MQAIGYRPVAVYARTMVIDSPGSTAYVLTTSGLSIIPLDQPAVADRPQINPKGAVNLASYQTTLAQNAHLYILDRNHPAYHHASAPPWPTIPSRKCAS